VGRKQDFLDTESLFKRKSILFTGSFTGNVLEALFVSTARSVNGRAIVGNSTDPSIPTSAKEEEEDDMKD
jgi:hypothetical protein